MNENHYLQDKLGKLQLAVDAPETFGESRLKEEINSNQWSTATNSCQNAVCMETHKMYFGKKALFKPVLSDVNGLQLEALAMLKNK